MHRPTQETGYECWLRYRRLAGSTLNEADLQGCRHLVVEGSSDVLASASAELTRGIGELFGTTLQVHGEPPREGGYVLLGSATEPGPAAALERTGALELPEEGFVLIGGDRLHDGRGASDSPGPVAAIVGGGERGCLYGVFAFLRHLQRAGSLSALSALERPAACLRMVDHWDNLDGSVERGYAGRSIFFEDGEVTGNERRIADYARLLASIGVNALACNNVNVDHNAMGLLTRKHLPRVAALAKIFRSYGIRLALSVGFSSPVQMGGLPTADPASPAVQQWWAEVADEVYGFIPDLLGFLVKADSESRPGPRHYGRTQAEGANALAAAVAPYGGSVIWRCFIYDCEQDWRDRTKDRAKAAYEEFAPLDGSFAQNVMVQIKNGPMDFQVREPVSPLLGAMAHTNKLLEVQVTQEYTGQQIHLCYLVPSWKETLDFDTYGSGSGSTVAETVFGSLAPDRWRAGMVGVANVGDDPTWTGHLLAQANLYGFGRLAWDPTLDAEAIAREWAEWTFGAEEKVIDAVSAMLMASWPAYESYASRLGLGWMVAPGHHYGPSVDGYEFSRWGTYHDADLHGLGVDRSVARGSGFVAQYEEPWRTVFEDPATCPEELLLFFHRMAYDVRLASGATIIQHIYDSGFEGVEAVEGLLATWRSLEGRIDPVRYRSVERRLVKQLASAIEWRDVVNAYFHRKSGVPDEHGRTLY